MGGVFASEEQPDYFIFKVNVKDKHFETRQEIEESFAALIQDKSKVNEIILSGNSYSVEACQAIGEILGECHSLEVANFSDMFVGRVKDLVLEGIRHLCEGLVKCRELVEVDFSDNAIGFDCMPGLQFLLENNVSIKRVSFNNNGLDKEAGSLLAQYLSASQGIKLEVFNAMRNRLQVGGFQAIAGALGNMGSLHRISVPSNTVSAEGTTAFLQCMQANPDLQELVLFDNVINTPEAFEALKAGVGNAQYLSSLNLGECLLENSGAEVLFEALSGSNTHLRELHIPGNDIEATEELADLLLAGLANKEQLELVNLKDNDIEDEIREKLTSAMPNVTWQFESDEEDELSQGVEDLKLE